MSSPVSNRPKIVFDADSPALPRDARSKIRPLDELSAIARQARQSGEVVVLCHGVFDLLHMGHVRHLQAARREGTVLIVTLTADRFVNKGPGRPVFPQQLRAEMLAAIEYVDWVAINEAPTAETVIHALCPSVYVKGSDYRDAKEDVTGKIVAERQAVESHGGRLAFTDDIVFSSSSLINRYLNVYENGLADYLDTMRASSGLERLTELVNRVANFRVLMIGDAIIDEYQYVTPLGKSPKENMIATLYQNREVFAGGVFAAANHVSSFCKSVDLITCLGDTDSYEELVRSSLAPNINLIPLKKAGAPTTRKTRFVESYSMRKLFEVYSMDDNPLEGATEMDLHNLLKRSLKNYDAVIVTDFGHGLLHGEALSILADEAPFLAINAQSNSANLGYNLITKYPRADFICIDTPEAHLAAGDKHCEPADLLRERLPAIIDCPNMIVTRGKFGCLVRSEDCGVASVPALTSTIVDTVGAGDAFF
ncbi:MAG: PfkB family carbohydrate kinase, partial [Alphaproteobacteria bacterium]